MGFWSAAKGTFVSITSFYRSSSRVLFLVALVLAAVLPVTAATTSSVTVSIPNSNAGTSFGFCYYGTCTPVTVTGNLSVSGSYAGPVYFKGQAVVWVQSVLLGDHIANWTFTSSFEIPVKGGHNPPMNYPSENRAYFSNGYCCMPGWGWNTQQWSITIYAYSDPGYANLLGSGTTVSSGQSDVYVLAVAVPLFNDTMLGATCQTVQGLCGPSDPNPSPLYKYQLPAGTFYNFIMAISLIVLAIGALLSYLGKVAAGKQDRNSILMDAVVGVVAILLFPLIYNNVATVINYLDQSIIAYPNPYTSYPIAIQNVWNQVTSLDTSSWWNVLWDAANTLAGWVISLILWIMLRIVGTVRLFIFAVVIVAFPVSMGLRLIPFTKKLSEYVQETLFGMILASLMSAVILGVAAYLFSNWNNPTNIFASGGIEEKWVAASALFAALLIPTVFAPLTSFVYMATSNAAITAGGVAASTMASAAAPVTGLGASAMGLGSIAGIGGAMGHGAASAGSALASSMQAPAVSAATGGVTWRHVGMALTRGLGNAFVVGSIGALGAATGVRAEKAVGRVMPVTSHQDMTRIIGQDIAARTMLKAKRKGANPT
ncbi:MAG TPA: hypothetical protein VGR56_05470 [Nitrososphaerales archaeon]|nr:hypothetical protein [Nitrososphaerales archaeon]